MTDRELLELAAKAHGKEIDLDRYDDEMGFIILGISRWWNPLTNDGDAFRLAVKLGMHVNVEGMEIGYRIGCVLNIERIVLLGDGLHAATRRAITRAAAAIQEAKEGV